MPAKFGRSAKLVVTTPEDIITIWTLDDKSVLIAGGGQTLAGHGLRISWDVMKTLDGDANQATITVYGLSEQTHKRITGNITRKFEWTPYMREVLARAGASTADQTITYPGLGVAYVQLEVGYQNRIGQIFEGDTQRITHRATRTESILTIEASDNGAGIREGMIHKTWGPSTLFVDVVAGLVEAMGGSVNATQRALLVALSTTSTHIDFPYGFTAEGQAHALLSEMLKLLAIKWSFQDGEFVLLDADSLLPLPPVAVDEPRGLVGQPLVLEDGNVQIVTLADSELRPGRSVLLTSRAVNGTYRVERAHHTGDTHADRAHVSCELAKVGIV